MIFKVGDRVVDDFLGPGEITEIHKAWGGHIWAYSALFDQRPPVQYNMGGNPALTLPSGLIREADKEPPVEVKP